MSDKVVCWNCETLLTSTQLFCHACQKIQQPASQNLFTAIGVEVSFSQDLTLLEKAYFKTQSQTHPDRFVNSTEKERLYASQQAASVNLAYQTLKDPLKRAAHLLEINGVFQQSTTSQDPDLLLEMMTLQEHIKDNKAQVLKEIKKRVSHSLSELNKAFLDKDYSLAEKNLARLKYLKRLQESD